MEILEIRLSVSRDELEDLRSLLFVEQRTSTLTGGSSVAAEKMRRRQAFKKIYDQLPQEGARTPDVQGR